MGYHVSRNRNHFGFTAREMSVLMLILEGRTYKEISHELNIKLRTVSCYVQKIHGAFGVHNAVGVLRAAQAAGILTKEIQNESYGSAMLCLCKTC